MKNLEKILLMLLLLIGLSLGAAALYLNTAYNYSTNELSKTFKTFKSIKSDMHAIEQTKPISILLMGVDTGSSERTSKWSGNSDTMILVTINPKTNQTTMTSLERDILIKLSGSESEAKLNAAYASGGAEEAISTVQKLLNLNIDYYMQINMQGLVDLVNAVGGITVTNTFAFPISISENEPEYKATVEPGTHKINGEQALVYSRMRYDDPEGDYGRQKRQREVITKVVKKMLEFGSVTSYKKVLSAISGNMQTNIEISSKTIPSLLGYTKAVKHIKSYQLKGEGMMLNGGSYQIVQSDHLLEVQNRIKKQLGLSVSSELKTTAILYDNLYGGAQYNKTYANDYVVPTTPVIPDNTYPTSTVPTAGSTTVPSSAVNTGVTADGGTSEVSVPVTSANQ